MRLRETLYIHKNPKKKNYVKFHKAVNNISLLIFDQSRSQKL